MDKIKFKDVIKSKVIPFTDLKSLHEQKGNTIQLNKVFSQYTIILLDEIKETIDHFSFLINLYEKFSDFYNQGKYNEFSECLQILYILYNGAVPQPISNIFYNNDKMRLKTYFYEFLFDMGEHILNY